MFSTLPNALSSRLEAARHAAHDAGQHTLGYFRRPDLKFERKSDDSPVTVADREAEQRIRSRITAHFPDDAVVGEEFDDASGSSGFRWILDPIDGTKSFIHGVPLYGTMIGIEQDGRSVIGVVAIPALGETVFACVGAGAWYQREGAGELLPARVSDVRKLQDALFLTSQVDSFGERHADQVYQTLQQQAYVTRTWGDCYGYLLVATGRAAVMVDPVMNVWDAAALQPILEEAGGCFTDWAGEPTIHSGEGIGTNPALLEQVLEITRPFAKSAR